MRAPRWKDGKCGRGHDLSIHMRMTKKGRRCGKCQKLWVPKPGSDGPPPSSVVRELTGLTVASFHRVPEDRGLWRTRARCRYADPELFHDKARLAEAAAWCDGCPVTAECLENAFATREQGVIRGGQWIGARTREERRRSTRRAA